MTRRHTDTVGYNTAIVGDLGNYGHYKTSAKKVVSQSSDNICCIKLVPISEECIGWVTDLSRCFGTDACHEHTSQKLCQSFGKHLPMDHRTHNWVIYVLYRKLGQTLDCPESSYI